MSKSNLEVDTRDLNESYASHCDVKMHLLLLRVLNHCLQA